MSSRKIAIGALGLLTLGLTGCVAVPVGPPPPPQPVYYAPGYYAAPAYPAYGYYAAPALSVDIGGRGGYGRWR